MGKGNRESVHQPTTGLEEAHRSLMSAYRRAYGDIRSLDNEGQLIVIHTLAASSRAAHSAIVKWADDAHSLAQETLAFSKELEKEDLLQLAYHYVGKPLAREAVKLFLGTSILATALATMGLAALSSFAAYFRDIGQANASLITSVILFVTGSTGFVLYLLRGVAMRVGPSVFAWLNEVTRGAHEGSQRALAFLERTITPAETRFFRLFDVQPPSRIVAHSLGYARATLIIVAATVVGLLATYAIHQMIVGARAGPVLRH